MSGDLVYAIDFGTSNSLLAAADGVKVIAPIPLDSTNHDPTVMRSTMYFSNSGLMRFGQDAIQKYIEESGEGRFIRSIKKFLPARSFTNTQIGPKYYNLENLIGCFLREMKERADRHFGQTAKTVVLGRPARFSADSAEENLAEQRLKNAALEAGFEQVHFFAEPLAAAFDYRKNLKSEKLVLIVDLGGGTSDFTVIKLKPKGFDPKDVLGLGGISVAGDALDGTIMLQKIAPYFGSNLKYKLALSSNVLEMPPLLKFKLMSPADITLMSKTDIMQFLNEVKKCTLNPSDEHKLTQLFELISDNLGFKLFDEIETCKRMACTDGLGRFRFHEHKINIDESLNYKEFSEMAQEKIEAIFATLDEVVAMAGVTNGDVDLICCTGGTAKVPDVREHLLRRFGQEKIQTLESFHSVIQGLAERAHDLASA